MVRRRTSVDGLESIREGRLAMRGSPVQADEANVKLVIFDFDGTLADSFSWLAGELNQVARRWRFRPVGDGEPEVLRHLSAPAILRHLGVPIWKSPWIARDLRARMARDIEHIRLFDGASEVLDALVAAGLRLAIASSNTEDNIARVLGPRLLEKIEALECRAALLGKHVRLKRLLRRTRIAAAEALYIGDEIRDIEAARRAGISAGAVTWGYNHADALAAERPALLFRELEEIPAVLTPRARAI